MAQLKIYNGPMQTTAAPVAVTTGTALKSLLQVKASATLLFKVKGWGYSFSGFAAAAPGIVELVEVDAAATVTASVAADITKVDGAALLCGDVTTNLIQVGTSATGYTSTSEGSVTALRNLHPPIQAAPTEHFDFIFPLGDEPIVQVSKFLRIRVTFGTAVNAFCYVSIEI